MAEATDIPQARPARRQKPLREVFLIVAARVAGALGGIAFTMLLSRSMGAAEMGQVSAAISLAMVLALACTTNIEAGGVRFMVQALSAGNIPAVRGFIRFSRRYVLAASAVAALAGFAILFLRADGQPDPALLLAVAAAPLLGWMRLGAGFSMGFSRPVLAVLPRTMFRPVIFAALLAVWITLAGPPDPATAMALFAASIVLVLLAQQVLLKRETRRSIGATGVADTAEWKDWVKIGLTMGLNVLFVEYSVYLAVLSGALVLPDRELALFDISLKLMALLKFGVVAVNQVFMPKLSRGMAQGNHAALQRWLALSGLMKLAILAAGIIGALVLGEWALGLFGPQYPAAYGLLLLLMADPALTVLFGPGSNLASFSKRPYVLLPALAVTLAVLLFGVGVLGSAFGLIGAGIAVVAARAVWVIGLAGYCWLKLDIDPTVAAIPRWLLSRRR